MMHNNNNNNNIYLLNTRIYIVIDKNLCHNIHTNRNVG